MDKELRWRIISFFDYWKERHKFISNLNLDKYSHEANVLIWASLDALSSLWAENIGKERCPQTGKRLIFDAFLACYGGEIFQLISLPDVWSRIDQGHVQVGKVKMSNDVCDLLKNIGGRRTPSVLEERKTRSISDDWRMDKIITEILSAYPQTDRIQLEEWLNLSRYGSIAYKQMRSAYIHEGRAGRNSHSFELHGSEIQPTYLSWVYTTPPIIGFKVEFMLRLLGSCIHAFESDALILKKDPVPDK